MKKTFMEFMKEIGTQKHELNYPNGYIIVFNKDNKMFVEGKNEKLDIEITFEFEDEEDFQDKCEEMLNFEVRFCDICGRPMNVGYTDDGADFYNCCNCFEKDMDERYGKGNWRMYESDDGKCNYLGGYYEYLEDDRWVADSSYYTEWF